LEFEEIIFLWTTTSLGRSLEKTGVRA